MRRCMAIGFQTLRALLLVVSLPTACGVDPVLPVATLDVGESSRASRFRNQRLENSVVSDGAFAANVRKRTKSTVIRREDSVQRIVNAKENIPVTAQLPLTVTIDKGGPSLDQLTAVVQPGTPELRTISASSVCQKPPCCPAVGCVFPFQYKGSTFLECTNLDEQRFWCGKDVVMTDMSEWDWCAPSPCDAVVENSEQKPIPNETAAVVKVMENSQTVAVPRESAAKIRNANEAAIEEKNVNETAALKSARLLKNDTFVEVARAVELKKRAAAEVAKAKLLKRRAAAEVAQTKKAAASKNTAAAEVVKVAEVDADDESPPLSGEKTETDDEKTKLDSTAKGSVCSSPTSILHGNPMGCIEGETIKAGHWCTPKCNPGKQPLVNVTGLSSTDACVDSDAFWGSKLCCVDGVLHPKLYTCVSDLFTKMDANNDGSISDSEFKNFQRSGSAEEITGHDTLRTVKKAVVEKTVRTLKEVKAELEDSDNKTADSDTEEGRTSFVYLYILSTTVFLVMAAVASVLLLVKQGPSNDVQAGQFTHDRKEVRQQKPSQKHQESKETSRQSDPAIEEKVVEATPVASDGQDTVESRITLVSDRGPAGVYEIVPGKKPNGFPLWKRSGSAEDFVYSGTVGQWFVGDADEKKLDFACDTGNIASRDQHEGVMPYKLGKKAWMWFDGSTWHEDDNIHFTATG